MLIDRFKCLVQRNDQIICILRAGGQPDGIRLDTLIQQFLLGELGMDRACRMNV